MKISKRNRGILVFCKSTERFKEWRIQGDQNGIDGTYIFIPVSYTHLSGYLKENEKKYHIHYSTNIPSDNGKNARGFQGIHTQIRIDNYRWYGWKADKKEFSKEAYMRISSGKSRDYRFLKSMEDTFIRLYGWILSLFYFLKGVLEMLKQPERKNSPDTGR